MIILHFTKTVFVIAMMARVTMSTPTRMSNADIYAVANFTDFNSEGFNHLMVHNVSGDVYIGGVNQLYRLNENLELVVNITTGPEYDDEDKTHDTFNKILACNYAGNDLITCGGYRGDCQIRHMEDLSETYSTDHPTYVAANMSDDSTIGFVAPHYHLGQQFLYVGTTSTSQNPGNPFVSGRQLEGDQVFEVFEDGNGNTRVDVTLPLTLIYSIRYVAGFNYNSYSYFVTIQQQPADSSSAYISKLVRVCQRAESNYFNSYTEVTLSCRDESYNLAQAAYITRPAQDLSQSLVLDDGEEVLFISFAVGVNNPPTPTTKSAICMYKMSDIERAFQDAVEGCMINDGPSV
ncbi:plexin A3-like [Ptychodera flava]|uniref:plexin A3-like n=1 Tax=Ptychodera flava TaxID=63121 RepID=UPI00396A09A9